MSEVQRLRASIEAEYRAAQMGLSGYACVARHDFITARLNRIADYHKQLSALIGKQEACATLIEINDTVISCKGEKVFLMEPEAVQGELP